MRALLNGIQTLGGRPVIGPGSGLVPANMGQTRGRAVSGGGTSTPSPGTITRALVRMHIAAVVLHATLAILCCVAAANRHWFLFGAKLPLWKVGDGGSDDPESRMIRTPKVVEWGTWDVLAGVGVTHAITVVAHATYAAHVSAGPRCRWWEYAITAPLVFLQLAITTGTRQVEVLLLIVAAVATAMPFGYACLAPVDGPAGSTTPLKGGPSGEGLLEGGWVMLIDSDVANAAPTQTQTQTQTQAQAQVIGMYPRLYTDGGLGGPGRQSPHRYRAAPWVAALPAGVTPFAATLVASACIATVLGVIMMGFAAIAPGAPKFVIGIVVVQLLLLSAFGVVGAAPTLASLLASSRCPVWCRVEHPNPGFSQTSATKWAIGIEVAFCVLSFLSKTLPNLIFIASITK